MANNLEVAARQCTYLNGRAARLRSALELMHMVRPFDNATILDLARFYMLHQMDLAKLVDVLNRIQEVCSKKYKNFFFKLKSKFSRFKNF